MKQSNEVGASSANSLILNYTLLKILNFEEYYKI